MRGRWGMRRTDHDTQSLPIGGPGSHLQSFLSALQLGCGFVFYWIMKAFKTWGWGGGEGISWLALFSPLAQHTLGVYAHFDIIPCEKSTQECPI